MKLRFLRYPGEPRPPPEPTPSEAYVLQEFPGAIALVRAQWEAFDAQLASSGPTPFSLRQRVDAFMMGRLAADLNERFPEIAARGAEADALTGMRGNTRAIFRLIVGEAIIAAGRHTRSNVRCALPD